MKRETSGMILIFITVFLWSTIEVVSKVINDNLPGMTISFLRFTLGGIFLMPICIHSLKKNGLKKVRPKDWLVLVLLSFLGITLTFALYHKALEWITATSVATLVSMVPIFVAPIGLIFLKERIGIAQMIGLLVGVAGIFLIYFTEEPDPTSVMGVVMMVIVAISFSVYSVLMKKLNKRMDPKVTTPISLFIGGLMTIPFTLLDKAPLIRPLETIGYVQLGYLAFVAVGLSYLLYFMGLERTKVVKGNSLLYLKPVLAGTLAWLILGDELTPARIASVVLITFSIYFVIKGNILKKKEKEINLQ